MDLPDELLQRLEAKAAEQCEPVTNVIVRTLAREFPEKPRKAGNRVKLPLISTGRPYTLTNTKIEEILTDEFLGRR